jgi:hypothetical protein
MCRLVRPVVWRTAPMNAIYFDTYKLCRDGSGIITDRAACCMLDDCSGSRTSSRIICPDNTTRLSPSSIPWPACHSLLVPRPHQPLTLTSWDRSRLAEEIAGFAQVSLASSHLFFFLDQEEQQTVRTVTLVCFSLERTNGPLPIRVRQRALPKRRSPPQEASLSAH